MSVADVLPEGFSDFTDPFLLERGIPHDSFRAARQQFAVLVTAQLYALQRAPDRGGVVVAHAVGGQHRRGFRETIALQNGQPEADEHARQVRRKRRAADDDQTQASAQAPVKFFCHQKLEHRPQQPIA